MQKCLKIKAIEYRENFRQEGTENREKALGECRNIIQELRAIFGPEPKGAQLMPIVYPQEPEATCAVVCWFESEVQESVDYAKRVVA